MVRVFGGRIVFLLCFSLALTDTVRRASIDRIDKFVCRRSLLIDLLTFASFPSLNFSFPVHFVKRP